MSQAIDVVTFRETLGHYPTGVAVVTAVAEDGNPAGMVVGSFTSVSLNPPLIAFFPTAGSDSFAYLQTAKSFCVNVLASDQEALCRQFVSGKGAKFDGVQWRPSALGAPILDGAVCWIECTFEEIRPAGDHLIVLGLVHELVVERSTLPLLFFQGGYGRFSPASLVAAPDPELIQSAQLAESIRDDVEAVSNRFGVNCSVLAKVGWDGLHVLAANRAAVPNPFPLGHRMPIIPPLGAAFMVYSSNAEVDEWLERAPGDRDDLRRMCRVILDRVRDKGFSILVAAPEIFQRHREVVTEFERSNRLPRNARLVETVTADLADLYEPDLIRGEQYEIESIVVPIKVPSTYPAIALRMTGIPGSTRSEHIETLIDAMKAVAADAANRLR